MGITMAALDAGYETSHILEFCKGRRDVIAVRGVSGSYKPSIARVKSERHGKRGDILRSPRDGYFTVGIDSIKSSLFVDLSKDDAAAAGYIAFPSDCEDRLFQELTSEHRVAVKRMGQIVFRWEKVSDRQANELLDCYVYAQAAMSRHGCSWISAERWAQLEAQCSGSPAPPRKILAEAIAEMLTYG
jgi:phage terminase large subunit GpA-like protein